MAQLLTTLVTGRAGGTAPASDLTDYIRLQEFNTFASGVSRPGHTHVAADIVDLTAATGLILAQVIGDSDTVVKILAGANPLLLSGLAVRLKAGGGILKDAQGLYLDPSGLSRPGHTHVLAEILDFDARLPDKLAAVLLDTNSVHWLELSGTLRANVREKVGGAILEDSGGIYVDLGSGVAQAARGNHTHADEHAPVTLGFWRGPQPGHAGGFRGGPRPSAGDDAEHDVGGAGGGPEPGAERGGGAGPDAVRGPGQTGRRRGGFVCGPGAEPGPGGGGEPRA